MRTPKRPPRRNEATPLTPERIVAALHRVAARLDAPLDLLVIGGAAMLLHYGGPRSSTRDVDAVVLGGDITADRLRAIVRAVARDLDLESDWLNDAAKGFIRGVAVGELVFSAGPLRVFAVAPEQLIAMKLCAWRDARDTDDAVHVITRTLDAGRSPQDLWAAAEPFLLPGCELKAWYAFQDIVESAVE